MILKLTYYGNPILRKKAAPIPVINDEIRAFASDLLETMQGTKNGIGLAAPQVNRSIAIFVVQFPNVDNEEEAYVPGQIEFFINPKLLEVSDEKWFHSEGCLSLPALYRDVERPLKIKIQYQNLDGEVLIKDFEGYEARMVLHENDHLNGVLFIDRLAPKVRKSIENELRAIKKMYA